MSNKRKIQICNTCPQSLACEIYELCVPSVCPVCFVEWIFVAPKGILGGGKFAMCFGIEIPVECIRGPLAKSCPACDVLRDQGTQLNFDEAASNSDAEADNISRLRAKWKETCNEYFAVIKKRQKEAGRLGIHRDKQIPVWREEMEWTGKEGGD